MFTVEAANGTATLRVYDVPPDVQLSAVPGTPVVVPATSPYQNAYITFTGAVGQRVAGQFSANTYPTYSTYSHVATPSGGTLYSTFNMPSSPFMDLKTLTQAGTYVLSLNPTNANTGGVTFTLLDVPPDPAPALTVNDPALTIPTTTPGQNAEPTFVGAVGQVVTVRLSGNTLGSVTVTLVRPNGTTQATTVSSATSFNMASQTLSTAGTYMVKINPSGAATGSIGVRVTVP